jgi:LPS-assembly lipoprotein
MALLTAALASVIGCGGWYLRGQGEHQAPFQRVYIKSERPGGAVDIAVRRELFNRGLTVVGQRNNADVVVELEDEKFERRILSVDPETGKVREIELGLAARFSVRTPDGRLLVPSEPLNWQLDYVFDEAALLGTVEQDVVVQQDLAKIAATTLVFRLQTVELPPPTAQ